MKVTHATIHVSSGREGDPRTHYFEINVGSGDMEREITRSGPFVTKIALPKKFAEPLEDKVKPISDSSLSAYLGHIHYSVNKGHAQSIGYKPKGDLLVRSAVGLPALLELACAEHLKSLGVKTISTSTTPNGHRKSQLKRLGLKEQHPHSIDEWIAALRKATEKETK